jgi:succinate dehydrogenase (ubiquinone) iron-sulfur subunit
MKRFLVYRYNP